MGPVQTLHEFALNLLSDPQALADFNADPQAVLSAAGLADVSAADVHEIIPLVMDLAPTSVTDSFGSTGDVASTLDTVHGTVTEAAAPLSDVLNALPNLSGVFGAVSDVAEQTGLNTVAHEALGTVSGVVDNVADAVAGVPIVGPVLEAGAIDLENTVDAVGEHLFDGQLVGAAVDAVTNHLGDALMPVAVVDTVSELPVIGEPVGGLLEDVRLEGAALLGAVNTAIGSTPVGVQSGDLLSNLLAGDLSDVTTTATTVTGSVSANLGDLPVVGGAVAGVADTATGVLNTAADTSDFASTGDLTGTLDHVTAALPAAPALPVGDVVGTVTSTVGGLTAGAPAVTDVVSTVTSTVGTVTSHVPAVDGLNSVTDIHGTDATSSVTSVVSNVTDNLNIGHVTDVANVAGTDSGLLGDLHLGL